MTMPFCYAKALPITNGVSNSELLVTENSQNPVFSDVSSDAWYAKALIWCQKNGIMSGTSDTTFTPEGTLNHTMLTSILSQMNDRSANTAPPTFKDTLTDYDEKNDPVTREQAVTLLWQYAGSPNSTASVEFSDTTSISSWAQIAIRWANTNGLLEGMINDQQFSPKANIKRKEVASMLYHYFTDYTVNQQNPVSGKTLVAYFSATGNTQNIAQYIATATKANLYEIVPEVPYTDADLNYRNSSSRTMLEYNDLSCRPAISEKLDNIAEYDIIFLGYPIWYGQAPRIINTFLDSYYFRGKTIVPFCTSNSSRIGSSDTNLHSLAPEANWISGHRFKTRTVSSEINAWLDELQLSPKKDQIVREFNFKTQRVILNSGYEMPIVGLGTYSLSDEECQRSISTLLKAGGRLIDTAYMYHNEAAVGKAIRNSNIPREEIFVITKLYPSQFNNAKESIDQALERMGLDYIDMMLLHHPGDGDVEAYKALEQAMADGKIHSIGLSNWYIEELEDFLPQISITPALVQNEIHPYYQENDVIPYIQKLGIVMQGWYPLGGRGHTEEMLGNETISAIATDHGVTAAQVILRWNLQKGVVVIPGSSNPDYIRENLDIFDFELTQEEMNRINALDRGEKHDWY